MPPSKSRHVSHGRLGDVLSELVTEQRSDIRPFWQTFAAYYLGYCPRQAYLAHLGLRDTSDQTGRFRAKELVRDHVTRTLREAMPHLDVNPQVEYQCGPLRVVGRCSCYDPDAQRVYHVKPRNGWYKFHPPIERDIDQLHVYMAGLDARDGQLLYVSVADLADVRTWPPHSADGTAIEFSRDRFDQIVTKAKTIHRLVVEDGIPTTSTAIPFETCGCYLCETEELHLADVSESGACEDVSTPRQQPSIAITEAASSPHDETGELSVPDYSKVEPTITDS